MDLNALIEYVYLVLSNITSNSCRDR